MKQKVSIWILFFLFFFVGKILTNKYIGGFYSASRAYSWEQIYEDMPFTILYSIMGGFAAVIAMNLDKKNRENKKD